MRSNAAKSVLARLTSPVVPVVVVGLVGVALLVGRVLSVHEWNPTFFLALGEQLPANTAYAEELLGEVEVRWFAGHDGKYFFAQANDPWYLEPEVHAALLDRPSYRAQRMLYPTLASFFGLFPPSAVVWSMILLNLVAVAFGTWATARLAMGRGASPWVGLAFALNIGLFFEIYVDGGGVVAAALAVFAIWRLERGDLTWAVVGFSGAALARETMLAFAAGGAIGLWRISRRKIWVLVTVPVASVGLWGAYVRWRVSGLDDQGGITTLAVLPFEGFLRAVPGWFSDPLQVLIGFTLVGIAGTVIWRAVTGYDLLLWGSMGVIIALALAPELTWIRHFDVARAMAPALTAFIVAILAPAQMPIGWPHRPARSFFKPGRQRSRSADWIGFR